MFVFTDCSQVTKYEKNPAWNSDAKEISTLLMGGSGQCISQEHFLLMAKGFFKTILLKEWETFWYIQKLPMHWKFIGRLNASFLSQWFYYWLGDFKTLVFKAVLNRRGIQSDGEPLMKHTYLARGSTVINKAVPSGRGSPIALRMSWPLQLPQMWVTWVHNLC